MRSISRRCFKVALARFRYVLITLWYSLLVALRNSVFNTSCYSCSPLLRPIISNGIRGTLTTHAHWAKTFHICARITIVVVNLCFPGTQNTHSHVLNPPTPRSADESDAPASDCSSSRHNKSSVGCRYLKSPLLHRYSVLEPPLHRYLEPPSPQVPRTLPLLSTRTSSGTLTSLLLVPWPTSRTTPV